MTEHDPRLPGKRREFIVPCDMRDRRLDLVISSLAGLSRSVARRLVEAAFVTVNGRPENFPSRKVAAGDRIAVVAPQEAAAPVGEPRVIHEDPAVIVVDKPAGMLTNREGGEKGIALEDWLRGSGKDVFPVHRLDRDTSGVVLFARTRKARDLLFDAFRSRQVQKRYFGIVAGVMKKKKGLLRGLISGKEYAETRFEVLKALKDATLLILRPRTGRTHQIRIQLARIGHPLIGEKKYLGKGAGAVGAPFARHALHAAAIELLHPVTHRRVKYSAPLPGDMKGLLRKLSV